VFQRVVDFNDDESRFDSRMWRENGIQVRVVLICFLFLLYVEMQSLSFMRCDCDIVCLYYIVSYHNDIIAGLLWCLHNTIMIVERVCDCIAYCLLLCTGISKRCVVVVVY